MKFRLFAAVVILLLSSALAGANPYLPKPGERPMSMRVSTCAVSGGFIHLYTALDNGLFDKYGIKLENVFIRGSAQNLTALATDEVQFTYCASDAIIPGMAAGIEVKIVASPLVKLPYVLITRKEVRRPEDLKGKALGIARAGDLSDRLSRAVVKKLGLSPDSVTIRNTSLTISGARPCDGSSRISTFGFSSKARAIDSISCSPPDNCRPRFILRSSSRGKSA